MRLLDAAKDGKVEEVKALLKTDIDINLTNVDGNNALWFGCFKDNREIVDLLVEAGIDINNLNDNGVSVMMYVASSGKEEMVKLLLEHGADISLENVDGFKAIDLCATPTIYRLLKNATVSPKN